ncbi:hypothetical protein [Isoptericola sp. NPDC056134]|uniref:hypothetical protein n=1 Tax=Isoptericola sp. NPDC056134 TaxID=3345723 RepID=UPI0035EB3190
MTTDQPTFESAEDLNLFLADIGLKVIALAVNTTVHGWTRPQNAAPYMHGPPNPAWDLVQWCAGNKEAEARMRELAADWAPAVMEVAFAPITEALDGFLENHQS